jgi:hypothetical protein
MKSQLRGIGPICYERPRCSKCNKPIKRKRPAFPNTPLSIPELNWEIWSQYGMRNDSEDVNPESGLYFWVQSKCCNAKIENAQIIYDEYKMNRL